MSAQHQPPPFDVETSITDGAVVVRPLGELDISSAPTLQASVAEAFAGGRAVTIDLGGLTFIDSTGLHLLVMAAKRSRDEGVELVLLRGSENVHRPIEVCGLAGVLPFAPEA